MAETGNTILPFSKFFLELCHDVKKLSNHIKLVARKGSSNTFISFSPFIMSIIIIIIIIICYRSLHLLLMKFVFF